MAEHVDHVSLSYPSDPSYGSGACRRRVRLAGSQGRVVAVLSDTFHELRCTIRHDGYRVTAVKGEAIRIPTSVCPAAVGMIQELVGTPIDAPGSHFYEHGRARRHCTHLFDLAVMAIGHGRRGKVTRTYEAVVPDETDRPVRVEVRRDDELVHCWWVRRGRVVKPANLADRPLGKGFAAWATLDFQGDALEAAILLSRTWLIAVGRRYRTESFPGHIIARNVEMIGACYAYAPGRAHYATFNSGHVRDFTTAVYESGPPPRTIPDAVPRTDD